MAPRMNGGINERRILSGGAESQKLGEILMVDAHICFISELNRNGVL